MATAHFRHVLAGHLREQAEIGGALGDSPSVRAHARLLRLTAEHIESLDERDAHLGALVSAQAYRGLPARGTASYTPGHEQARVIALVGRDPNEQPTAAIVLDALVAAAVDDVYKTLTEQHANALERDLAKAKSAAAESAARRVEAAQAKEAKAKAEIAGVRSELAEAHKQIAHLKAMLPEDDPKPPKPKPSKSRKPKATPRKAPPKVGTLSAAEVDELGLAA